MEGTNLPVMLVVLGSIAALGWWLTSTAPPPRPRPVRIHAADPLLDEARARARSTFERFRRLAARHPGRAMVKVRIDRADGAYRGQWADVVHVGDDVVKAVLRGPGRPVTVSRGELEDWQVEVEGGRWHGGWSVVASWRIRLRETGTLPDEARQHQHRFLDAALEEGEG